MIENDTVCLLRECDSGIKMGVDAIADVADYASSEKLKELLLECKLKHTRLEDEINELLEEYHDDGKAPNPVAKGMSWIKTNVKLIMNESDNTIADLITDGCNMGTKSLARYLNKYKAASEEAKSIAKRLIKLESALAEDMRGFL